MAQKAYLNMDQGTDFSAEIEVQSYLNNINFDLQNHVITAHAKKSWQSDYYFEFDTEVIDTAAGKFVITMPYTKTASMEPGRYMYDIVLTNINTDQKYRVIEGILTVNPGITLP